MAVAFIRNVLRAGLIAFASILFVATVQAADPIKIGVTVTQSPPGSVVQGTQVKDGLEIVAKIINDGGGVNGRPIELVIEDTQGLPEKARAAVEKLITRDKVVAITGEHQSSAALRNGSREAVSFLTSTNGWSDAIRRILGFQSRQLQQPSGMRRGIHEVSRRQACRRFRGEYRLRHRTGESHWS
jgi:hypothetical protein